MRFLAANAGAAARRKEANNGGGPQGSGADAFSGHSAPAQSRPARRPEARGRSGPQSSKAVAFSEQSAPAKSRPTPQGRALFVPAHRIAVPWCVFLGLATLTACAGAGVATQVRDLCLLGPAAAWNERRLQLQLDRASRRSWAQPEGFGNLPYRRPFAAAAYIQDYTLESEDKSDGACAQDPEIEFNGKLPLASTAHMEIFSEIQDLKGEVQIQQAMVRQLSSDLHETREEAAQLQKAKDALQEKLDELAKEKSEAEIREQEKQNELQCLRQQLSLVEKELKWERRLLAKQKGLLRDELERMGAAVYNDTATTEIKKLSPQHGSEVTESYSDSTGSLSKLILRDQGRGPRSSSLKTLTAPGTYLQGEAESRSKAGLRTSTAPTHAHKGPAKQPSTRPYRPLVDLALD